MAERRRRNGSFAENPDYERQLKALRLRKSGYTYREIGVELGVSEPTAYRDVQAVIARTKQLADETADEIRRVELERLDRAVRGLMPLVDKGSVRAAEVLVKLQERRAKFLGLDAPTKQSVDVGGNLADVLALGFGAGGEDPAGPVEK